MTAEFVFKQDGQGNELIVLLACLTVQNAAHEKMMHTVQLLASHLQCPVTRVLCAMSYLDKNRGYQ